MTLRVACLGAGYFAQFHHDGWHRNLDTDLVAVCDLDLDAAKGAGVSAFSDLGEMLEQIKPDILDIITPPPTHADAILSGLRARVRAVICQKPFCADLVQAKEVAALAKTMGIPLIVHENFRFQPWYRAIKAQIRAGAIGVVHQVSFRLRTGDGQGPKAYLDRQPYFQDMPRFMVHETAVHWIDTFSYLLGQPEAIYADLRRMNPAITGEDAGYLVMDFAGGVRALFDGNRHLDHAAKNPRLTFGEALIEGTKGTLSLSGDGSVTLRKFGKTKQDVVLPSTDYRGFAGDCVYALQSHVSDALLGKGSFENEAVDYLNIRRIEDAAYQSSLEGRKISL